MYTVKKVHKDLSEWNTYYIATLYYKNLLKLWLEKNCGC